jgi:DNA-directed RNA polymerase subunit M/transcription elongation factor TFIIS
MADIAVRLRSVKERVAELARRASATGDEDTGALVEALNQELDRAIEEATRLVVDAGRHPPPPRVPHDDLVKCPRCTLRTYVFQRGTMRESAEDPDQFEGFYICSSCGHEGWRETS